MSDRPDPVTPPPTTHAAEAALVAALSDALRQLTANLLRVTRRAGRPEDILLQTMTVMQSFTAYREAMGTYPPAEVIATALWLELAPDSSEGSWEEWDRAVHEMVRGALQVTASELLAQPSQARAGRRELFSGYRRIEKLHGRQLRRLLRR